MASKHPAAAGKSQKKPRQNTPLLFLLLGIIPLFGGYYDFSVLLAGFALAVFLFQSIYRSGSLRLPIGLEAWCLYGLWCCMLLVIPFAVSPGMAFTGFLRISAWVLFFLYAATYSGRERSDILDVVAYEGAILALGSIAAFLYDRTAGIEDPNGRIDGFFQYANTWALFLLVCLILLALREKRQAADWPAMAVLLCGVYLSGSRGVFLLALLLAVVFCFGYVISRRRVLPLLWGVGAVLLLGGASVLLSGGMVLERLKAITVSSSSLNGRLLYYWDGLRILWEHPLGLGRGGYFYLQPLVQTGVYTLRYIHNEYLQAALDGGVLAGICLMAFLLAALVRKNVPLRERAVGFAIAAHALIDFDFQFSAVVFLLLLCAAGGKTKEIVFHAKAVFLVFALVFGYFSAAYYMDFSGHSTAAYAMFSADLMLAENRLQSFSSVELAEPAADQILASTDLSMLAWDCKFMNCAQRGDLPGMVRAKYQYLRLNRYRGEVYEDFAALLEQSCEQGSQAERSEYQALAQSAILLLEEVNQTTSPLAYRIADKPELEFSTEILTRLQNMLERTER